MKVNNYKMSVRDKLFIIAVSVLFVVVGCLVLYTVCLECRVLKAMHDNDTLLHRLQQYNIDIASDSLLQPIGRWPNHDIKQAKLRGRAGN